MEEHPNFINAKDKNGFMLLHHKATPCAWTPFFLVSLQGHPEISETLIKTSMQIDKKDRRGRSPLHLASFSGDKNLAELLIAEGVEIDERDYRGETALPSNG